MSLIVDQFRIRNASFFTRERSYLDENIDYSPFTLVILLHAISCNYNYVITLRGFRLIMTDIYHKSRKIRCQYELRKMALFPRMKLDRISFSFILFAWRIILLNMRNKNLHAG